MRKIISKSKREYVIQDILIGILLVGIVLLGESIFFHYFGCVEDYLLLVIPDGSELDLLLNQYTITFLIISLLSLLSGNRECIYWVDILEHKIILPLHRNFISLTIYSFLSMLAGTIAYVMCDKLSVLTFFFYDVVILIILTFKMVGVYFGKAKIQQRLYNEIIKDVRCYLDVKDEKTFDAVSDKLNGMYEKAYQLAQDGKFNEIIKTDLQLLIDLTKIIPTEYDEKLVKLIYNNFQKIIMLFSENPEILLNELFERKKAMQYAADAQTETILNSAMCAFFESVLSKHEYKVAYDSWIEKTYNILAEAYQRVEDDLEHTMIVSDGYEYHNLLVDIWYNPVEKNPYVDVERVFLEIDDKVKIMKSRLIYYSKLIYENSPFLFFSVVSKKPMSKQIQKEMELFSLICEHGELAGAKRACKNMCNQMPIFMLSKYFAEYEEYINMPSVIEGMDEEVQEPIFDKEKFYEINDRFLTMLRYAAFESRSPEIIEYLLGILNSEIVLNSNKICNGADKYPMLINSENIDALFYNVRLKGFELNKLLETIEQEYEMYKGIMLWINKIKPLCEGGYNLSDYALYARANISEFDFY